MSYAEKLRNPKWQKKRLRILERDGWKCCLCSDESTELHVHHKKYNGNPWDADDEYLITYCKHCHFVVESIGELDSDVSIIRVDKYVNNSATNILIVLFLKLNPDRVSVYFATYSEEQKNITNVIYMKPLVIRDANSFLDELKEEMDKTNK